MHTHQLTGLETIQHLKAGLFPEPTMAQTIPMKIEFAALGTVEFSAVATEKHLNPMGGVHGGFAATVMDSATGAAVHTVLKKGESYGTVDLNVKMLKPIPIGKRLLARGTVVHRSNRLGISEANLTDADGKLYAHATATCMILQQRITPVCDGEPIALHKRDKHTPGPRPRTTSSRSWAS